MHAFLSSPHPNPGTSQRKMLRSGWSQEQVGVEGDFVLRPILSLCPSTLVWFGSSHM
jgi:hypothetical protein